MPTKPQGPCRWPGCPKLQEPGCDGYCREHRRAAWRSEDKVRGSSRQRGYTRSYERTRRAVLNREPLCAVCLAEGKVVAAQVTHHIHPLAEGGSNRADNLLPVCRVCHDRLHSKGGPELLKKILAVRENPGPPVVV